jgi:hypothetical protein
MGMMGFRVRINVHGEVLEVEQPGMIDPDRRVKLIFIIASSERYNNNVNASLVECILECNSYQFLKVHGHRMFVPVIN